MRKYLIVFLLLQILSFHKSSFLSPAPVETANLATASATLANPQLYVSDENLPDNVNQKGSLTLTFKTTIRIPDDGNILVEIPAVDDGVATCDGLPDSAESVLEGGFDLGGRVSRISPADITITGCGDTDWETATITCGTTKKNHTIQIERRNASCPADSAITITIDNDPGLINPAPLTKNHLSGTADIYSIDITTRDADNQRLDTIDMQVALIEPVFTVQTTVPQTLQLTVAGVSADSPHCGTTGLSRISTRSDAVPFGLIDKPESFYDAQQLVTVSTNSESGYTLTIEQNDQMGKDAVTCPSAKAGELQTCIQDTTCDNKLCSEKIGEEADWQDPNNNGLGFSLANAHGNDTTLQFDKAGGSCHPDGSKGFCTRQIPDRESGENAAIIMKNNGPVEGSATYVCYRLSVSDSQPPGFYSNNVTYTARVNF